MKIRAITLFAPLRWPLQKTDLTGAGAFLRAAKMEFQKAGYPVQTLRLATPPFMDVVVDPEPNAIVDFAVQLESMAAEQGIDYVSIGPVMAHTPRSYLAPIHILPRIIEQTSNVFATVLVGAANTGLNLAAIQATADAIHRIGQSTPDGFGNLRLAMLANVAPEGPFFPGSYHNRSNPSFAIATEAADLAVDALKDAPSLAAGQERLVNSLNEHASRLSVIVDDLVDEHMTRFAGIDFSLAPFPERTKSIGAAMEHLGVEAFGAHGTLFATAFLTQCLRLADYPAAGYCGVMLPVLEDPVLANAATTGNFSVNDLLLYSAVCGTGLDTVPVPGDASPEQIAALLLDVAALAVSLDKPLTARLLPVPGLSAGDMTTFEFEFFANSHVLPLKSIAAPKLFANDTFFNLTPRKTAR